jgi:hypothetical protein
VAAALDLVEVREAGSPSGAWRPIASVTAAPASPPWATWRVSPSRSNSSAHARAIRPDSQPSSIGSPEKP